jgi:hypothetical protein
MIRASLAICLALIGCDDSPPASDDEADARPRVDSPDAAPPIDDSDVPHQVVFATSSKQSGDLGGLAAADDICAARAADARLDGTFRAWLSSSDESAGARLTHASTPYARTDGVEVAADWDDLVDGALSAPIDRDENGERIDGDVWTGTLASGEPGDVTCAGFADQDVTGVCGSCDAADGAWTDNIRPPCTSALRLYCVQE